MHERDAEAVLLLADSLLGVGKPAGAVELLRGLAEADSGDVRARTLLARALLAAGDYAAAEPVAESLAGKTGEAPLPAIFFYAHALWGCGKLDACRRQIDRYADALAAGSEDKDKKPV